jgi:hypothetical protein
LNPEEIKQNKANWLMKTSFAAMIWAKPYEGPAWKYDVTSMYPALLQKQQFLIPIKRGEFSIMLQEEFATKQYLSYGIYRAKVNNTKPYQFKSNFDNYYTHIDLKWAKELGLTIELIQDDSPNCLTYNRDKLINANAMFRDYVNILFDLKKKGIQRAKPILNILWGALCQVEHFKYRYNKETN